MKFGREKRSKPKQKWCITFLHHGPHVPFWTPDVLDLIAVTIRTGRDLCRSPSDLDHAYSAAMLQRHRFDEPDNLYAAHGDAVTLAFSPFGVAVLSDDQIFAPPGEIHEMRRVLFYEYDSMSFQYCDVHHFVTPDQALTLVADLIGVEAAPAWPDRPKGTFVDFNDYLKRDLDLVVEIEPGILRRPRFVNRLRYPDGSPYEEEQFSLSI